MTFRKTGLRLSVLLFFAVSFTLAQSNPVPLISNPLIPANATPGGGSFTLTVNGSGFVQGAEVHWNGVPLTTTFVSGSQVKASVPAANIANPSTALVKVRNPAPGGGSSNVVFFEVVDVVSSVDLVDVESLSVGGIAIPGDFNNDGNLDVAIANDSQFSGRLYVLLGNGDGTFQPRKTFAAGSLPDGIVSGDFNGDGILDLVVSSGFSDTVAIYLGKGDGRFAPQQVVANISYPGQIVVADLNGDGKLDLAVEGSSLTILLGNGDGTFQESSAPLSGPGPLATGDFNHDGKLDLAAINSYPTDGFSVLFGNGDGTFQSPVYYLPNVAFWDVVTADFNGDGNLDLAFSDQSELGGVSVVLGNPDGTFQPEQTFAAPAYQYYIATADVNGDGKFDLLSSSEIYGLSVLLGNGDGTFQSPLTFAGYPGDPVAGDFNNDGKVDVFGDYVLFLEGPVPAVALNKTALGFLDQLVGTSQTQAVTLTNPGNGALTITSIVTSDGFSQTNTCGSVVPGGGSCIIDVIFTPLSDGKFTGTVTINDNALIQPQKIRVVGRGTYVGLSPTYLAFGLVKYGSKSAPQTVTLTNNGTSGLTISSITLTGFGFRETNDCGSVVPGGGSCTFTVTFIPPKIGPSEANIKILDSSGGGQGIRMRGYGTH